MSEAAVSLRTKAKSRLPIGIFDSGVGGLTVLAALRRRLPRERFCYLGDTARLPYGTKSSDTIARYSLQVTKELVKREIKLLVVACNTATAAALPLLRQAYPELPVIGVVEPGARAACKHSPGNAIAVLATEATIRNQAYGNAIRQLRPEATVTGVACTLFVSLAEEGWMAGRVAESIAARYLAPLLAGKAAERARELAGEMPPFSEAAASPDCLVLGCTHFPPLAPVIRSVVGSEMLLVDSAATTAEAVEECLRELHLLYSPQGEELASSMPAAGAVPPDGEARLHFLITDAPERFMRVGSLFLGAPIDSASLELISL